MRVLLLLLLNIVCQVDFDPNGSVFHKPLLEEADYYVVIFYFHFMNVGS